MGKTKWSRDKKDSEDQNLLLPGLSFLLTFHFAFLQLLVSYSLIAIRLFPRVKEQSYGQNSSLVIKENFVYCCIPSEPSCRGVLLAQLILFTYAWTIQHDRHHHGILHLILMAMGPFLKSEANNTVFSNLSCSSHWLEFVRNSLLKEMRFTFRTRAKSNEYVCRQGRGKNYGYQHNSTVLDFYTEKLLQTQQLKINPFMMISQLLSVRSLNVAQQVFLLRISQV